MTTPFNIAKGREAYFASLPGANDALVLVWLEATDVASDATLRDFDTLAAVLAGTSNEQTTLGRSTLTGVTATVDDSNDRVALAADDVVIAVPAGAAVGKALVCYDPDTTGGTDTDVVPISSHDFAYTPNGIQLTLTLSPFYYCG